MSRALAISALVFGLLSVVYATENESVAEPTSIPFIPSRMKLADTVEIPYWLYVLFVIIAVCQICQCCCGCCMVFMGGAGAASGGSGFRFGAQAKKVLQTIV